MADVTSKKTNRFLIGTPQNAALADGEAVDLGDVADKIEQMGLAFAAAADDDDAAEPAAQVLDKLSDDEQGMHTLVVALSDDMKDQVQQQFGPGVIIEPDEPLDMLDAGFMRADQIAQLAMMPASDEVEFRIRVLDGNGKAVPKVRVALDGQIWSDSGLTNTQGRVTLTMFGETPDTLSVLMAKPSMDFWSLRIADPVLAVGEENVLRLRPLGKAMAGGEGFPEEQTVGWSVTDMGLTKKTDPSAVVRLAVIDSGIAGGHPDLEPFEGFDFGDSDDASATWQEDGSGHGTHVAGMCAGLNNEIGIRGFAPGTELIGLRIFPEARNSKLIAALDWCKDNGVDVVNMSLGGKSASELVHQRIQACRDSGVFLVAAAGNNGGDVLFPAAFDEVMAVAAIGKHGSFPEDSSHQRQIGDGESSAGKYFTARFTCHGPEVDVCGPGVAIVSSVPAKGYAAWDGTSMASPHVAGLAARMLQENEGIRTMGRDDARSQALWDAMIGSCVDLGLDAEYQGQGLPSLSNIGGSSTDSTSTSTDNDALVELRALLDQAISIVETDLQDA